MIRAWAALSLVIAIGISVGVYVLAGRMPGPTIEILHPTELIGRSAVFEAIVETPAGQLTSFEAVIEQDDNQLPLFSLDRPAEGEITQERNDQIRLLRIFDHESHPELHAGAARLKVSATRPVFFGLHERSTSAIIDVQVRLDPPQISVLSALHYINHGGSELVVYKVTPPDGHSGVRVGNRFYRGYPASAAGVQTDDAVHVAFFALLHDQDLTAPIELYARDAAGNETSTRFDYQVFPTQFRRSNINVDNMFLRRIVPQIVDQTPELADENPGGSDKEWLDLYLFINRELRRRNRNTISALAVQTNPLMFWSGPFRQPLNSQVESRFADHRTYFYDGKEIDQAVHLGFDLASTATAPVLASNNGTVIYSEYVGIFGNCVVIDHGMGLQSLYAHLSSIEVSEGDFVERDQQIGRSGQTGLAGGDHLHFEMLLRGQPVTPLEWWDPHWIEDRILRKLVVASQSTTS